MSAPSLVLPVRRVVVARRLALLAGSVTLLACTGCYERVVGVKGAAADQYDVSEPYQESSAVDNWIWGEETPKEEYRAKPGIRTR